MGDLGKLNQFLETQSFIGSEGCATLVDYAKCKEIKSVDAGKFPHVARWHGHVSYLMERFPTHDWRGSPIPKGVAMDGKGPAAAPAAPSKESKPAAAAKADAGKKSPKGKPAPDPAPPASGGIDEEAIKAVGDEIRILKEKLKAEGKSGKQVNNDPQIVELVEKLNKLKKGEAVAGSASPKAEPKKEGKKGKKEEKPAAEKKEEVKDPAAERKAQLKKVIKEGGKRGVEIEGAADMGGLGYFCTSVEEPQGDMEMLDECMKAMNAKSDPTEEERKGGSGHIGKMLFSAGTDQLGILAYIPDDKKSELDCGEWIKHVVSMIGGKVESSTKTLAKAVVKTDSNKGIFPLKVKEPGIMEAIQYLKKKGLFPDKDDSDDEYVFGDDDFPNADDY